MANVPLTRRRPAVHVQVCDGCCCGTERKHPGVDHAGIRARLAAAVADAGGHMRVVGCVDECSRSNVVIVRPARSRAHRVWVGDVLEDSVVEALCRWVTAGADAPPPAVIAARVFLRHNNETAAASPEPTRVEIRSAR